MAPVAAEDHHEHPESQHHGPPKLLYYTNHNSEGFTDCKVLLHDKSYRIIRIDHGGLYDETGFQSFSSIQQMLNLSLPRCDVVEPADWTFAALGTHPVNRMPYLYEAHNRSRLSIQPIWHPTIIQLKDLNFDVASRADTPDCSTGDSGNVSPVLFNGEVCVAKLDKWNTRAYSSETLIYSQLEGKGIAPEFLGHISEGDLVVGFLLRAVSGRKAKSRDFHLAETFWVASINWVFCNMTCRQISSSASTEAAQRFRWWDSMEAGRRSKDAARRIGEDAVITTSGHARETTRAGGFVLEKIDGLELNCEAPQEGITP